LDFKESNEYENQLKDALMKPETNVNTNARHYYVSPKKDIKDNDNFNFGTHRNGEEFDKFLHLLREDIEVHEACLSTCEP